MDRDKIISILRDYYKEGWIHQLRFTPLIGVYIDLFGNENHKKNKQLFLETLKKSPSYHRCCLEYAIDELVNHYSVVKIVKTYPTPSGGIAEEIVTVY
jgi:hypothetical protein